MSFPILVGKEYFYPLDHLRKNKQLAFIGLESWQIKFKVLWNEGDMDIPGRIIAPVGNDDSSCILRQAGRDIRKMCGLPHDSEGHEQHRKDDNRHRPIENVDEKQENGDYSPDDENCVLDRLALFHRYTPLRNETMGPVRFGLTTSRLSAGRTTWLCYGPVIPYIVLHMRYYTL